MVKISVLCFKFQSAAKDLDAHDVLFVLFQFFLLVFVYIYIMYKTECMFKCFINV